MSTRKNAVGTTSTSANRKLVLAAGAFERLDQLRIVHRHAAHEHRERAVHCGDELVVILTHGERVVGDDRASQYDCEPHRHAAAIGARRAVRPVVAVASTMAIELESPLPATVLAEEDGLDDVQLLIVELERCPANSGVVPKLCRSTSASIHN